MSARTGAALLAAAAACLAPVPAAAADEEWHVAFGPIAGTIVLDQHLRDFRWDTRARAVWGAAGRAGRGPLGAGLRVWRTRTTQATGLPGDTIDPEVRLTGVDALGETRLARFAGFRLLATGSLGVVHVGYRPDRITVDDGTGARLDVSLDPITEGSAGLGIGIRRALFGQLDVSLGVDRTWFRLDTAHRAGDDIVQERETFGGWTARVELAHRVLQI